MEAEWKKKEHALLHQIEELLAEKKHCQDEIQQLCSSLEESRTKLTGTEQLVKKYELEKGQLMDEVESLTRNEVIIGELKRQLEQKTSEIAEGKELQQSLLEQSELNDKKLSIEQAKGRELLEDCNRLRTSYKQLKSQYLYLIRKLENNLENEHHLDRKQEVKSLPRSYPKKRRLQDYEENEEEITDIASQTDETKSGGGSHEDTGVQHDLPLVKRLTNVSHITHSSYRPSILPKYTVGTAKSEPIADEKKGSSSWRDTRAKEARGVDLHDDFLDTPLEFVRNINKLPCKEAQDIAVPPPKDMDLNNYDDETQDMNTKTIPDQQCISVLGPNKGGFKYVEPVRKKTERENLKGVECQQCKKFYDAVLLGDDGNPDHVNRRCEHHDGVSRHRYSREATNPCSRRAGEGKEGTENGAIRQWWRSSASPGAAGQTSGAAATGRRRRRCDILEEITFGGSPPDRAPFKGDRDAVMKLLHAEFQRGRRLCPRAGRPWRALRRAVTSISTPASSPTRLRTAGSSSSAPSATLNRPSSIALVDRSVSEVVCALASAQLKERLHLVPMGEEGERVAVGAEIDLFPLPPSSSSPTPGTPPAQATTRCRTPRLAPTLGLSSS
ncbi:hypothetical protein B296_00029904 [Ensete ventricosum]|uniref:DNA endonuclease activator Ctp1 C-terminal domain-containing protein n=1 Tax=Ensete ventricosum TaxID=4639 RepID=A0A426Z3N5_ENSVE|nr:hypothetical protein B296_00029904 [Ensete ventricosum]